MTEEKIVEKKPIDVQLLEDVGPKETAKKSELIDYAREHNIQIDEKAHREDIYKKIKETTALVPMTQSQLAESNAFQAMDNFDTDIVIQELMGQVDVQFKDAYIYEFRSGGKFVRGFTKRGVDEMAILSANYLNIVYRIMPGSISAVETGDSFQATVIVERYQLKPTPVSCPHCNKIIDDGLGITAFLVDTMVGAARQPKSVKTRDGRVRTNEFAFRVAISKAVRNAKLSLMSHEFKVKMMAYLLGEKKVAKLPAIEGDTKGRKIILLEDAFIDETQRRRLHAVAGKSGLSHEKLLEVLNEDGIESTNKIPRDLFKGILEKVEGMAVKVTLSDEIKKGLEIIGQTEEWAIAQLRAGAIKQGSVEKAEAIMIDYLNRKADEGATQ